MLWQQNTSTYLLMCTTGKFAHSYYLYRVISRALASIWKYANGSFARQRTIEEKRCVKYLCLVISVVAKYIAQLLGKVLFALCANWTHTNCSKIVECCTAITAGWRVKWSWRSHSKKGIFSFRQLGQVWKQNTRPNHIHTMLRNFYYSAVRKMLSLIVTWSSLGGVLFHHEEFYYKPWTFAEKYDYYVLSLT